MKQLSLLILAISLTMLLAIPWPCQAGMLLLWPEVPEKPVINLKVEDPITKEITDRELTKDEKALVDDQIVKQDNFTTVQASIKDTMTGKYSQVIDSKGPVWVKDGIKYSIGYIADPKRIKQEIKPSGTCTVIDTGKLGGAEWLRKNGYSQEVKDVLVEKDISK